MIPTPECNHCWHNYGLQSGGASARRVWSSGSLRCCHCGEIERYDYSTDVDPPAQHGPYYPDIERSRW